MVSCLIYVAVSMIFVGDRCISLVILNLGSLEKENLLCIKYSLESVFASVCVVLKSIYQGFMFCKLRYRPYKYEFVFFSKRNVYLCKFLCKIWLLHVYSFMQELMNYHAVTNFYLVWILNVSIIEIWLLYLSRISVCMIYVSRCLQYFRFPRP